MGTGRIAAHFQHLRSEVIRSLAFLVRGQVCTIPASSGRAITHISSLSIARMDHARPSCGFAKITGLSANHAAATATWRQFRVHTGTSNNGALAYRDHAPHGLA